MGEKKEKGLYFSRHFWYDHTLSIKNAHLIIMQIVNIYIISNKNANSTHYYEENNKNYNRQKNIDSIVLYV